MASFKAKVKQNAIARASASASGQKVMDIKKGVEVTVTKTSGSWWYVQGHGWVLGNSLQKVANAKKTSKADAAKESC